MRSAKERVRYQQLEKYIGKEKKEKKRREKKKGGEGGERRERREIGSKWKRGFVSEYNCKGKVQNTKSSSESV
jgi:hypothetical protein